MTAPAPAVPDGYMQDATGKLVPETMVKPIDKARDELVREIISGAEELSRQIAAFKLKAMGDIDAFVELSAERYGAKLGGRKGNVTLTTYDGRYKIVRQIADVLTFDEGLQAAKALIDECIHEWSAGSRDEIKTLVNDAFQVDKQGKVNTQRILGLRRLEIGDARWQRAMDAISDALRVVATRAYVRFYRRLGDTDTYVPISLDAAVL